MSAVWEYPGTKTVLLARGLDAAIGRLRWLPNRRHRYRATVGIDVAGRASDRNRRGDPISDFCRLYYRPLERKGVQGLRASMGGKGALKRRQKTRDDVRERRDHLSAKVIGGLFRE